MPSERLLTPLLVRAWIASFAAAFAVNIFLHLPGHLLALGADELLIGVIMSVFPLVAVFARLPTGWATDRYGLRSVILVGGALSTIACLLYLAVPDLGPAMFLVRALHGMAAVPGMMSFFTYAANRVPESRRTQGLGLFGLSGLLSISVAGLSGDWLVDAFGYSALFWAAGGASLLSLALAFSLPDAPSTDAGHQPRVREAVALGVRRDLLPAWVLVFAFGFSYAAARTFFKTWSVESGISSAGVFFASYSLTAAIVRVGLGWLPDRVGALPVLIPALLCSTVGIASLGLVQTDLGVISVGILCGCGHGMTMPILSTQVVTRAPAAHRGAAIAFQFAIMDAGTLLAGPLVGAFIGMRGYPSAFAASGLLIAFGMFAYAVLERRIRPARTATRTEEGATGAG